MRNLENCSIKWNDKKAYHRMYFRDYRTIKVIDQRLKYSQLLKESSK